MSLFRYSANVAETVRKKNKDFRFPDHYRILVSLDAGVVPADFEGTAFSGAVGKQPNSYGFPACLPRNHHGP